MNEALAGGDPTAAEIVACECVVLAVKTAIGAARAEQARTKMR